MLMTDETVQILSYTFDFHCLDCGWRRRVVWHEPTFECLHTCPGPSLSRRLTRRLRAHLPDFGRRRRGLP